MKKYTIKRGDNLTRIAKKFNTTVKELVKLNNIKDPDKIYTGDELIIPEDELLELSKIHFVKTPLVKPLLVEPRITIESRAKKHFDNIRNDENKIRMLFQPKEEIKDKQQSPFSTFVKTAFERRIAPIFGLSVLQPVVKRDKVNDLLNNLFTPTPTIKFSKKIQEPTSKRSEFTMINGAYTPNFGYASESLDLSKFRFGYRNRGQILDLNSNVLPVTSMNEFKIYDGVTQLPKHLAYIGINSDGKFVSGDKVKKGDIVAPVQVLDITGFIKKDGKYVVSQDSSNRYYLAPSVMQTNGRKYVINLLLDHSDNTDTKYGSIVGGRFIIEAGGEQRLVSGSLKQIDDEIEDMKKRHSVDSVKMYLLDNGTFNRGIRKRNGNITKNDLSVYDSMNTAGGHGLYIIKGES